MRYVPSAKSSVAIEALNFMSAEANIRIRDGASFSYSLLSNSKNVLSGCSGETGVAVTLKCCGMTSSFGSELCFPRISDRFLVMKTRNDLLSSGVIGS